MTDEQKQRKRERDRRWVAANREKMREYDRRYRASNLERVRDLERKRYAANLEKGRRKGRESNFRRKYGLSIEDRRQMVVEQGGLCALCREPLSVDEAGWHTDHDHSTGTVRGILHGLCNSGLGQFGDSIEKLKLAIKYLEEA